MIKAIVSFVLAACFIFAALAGCGDKGTNSTPSDLIGTWWYMSATLNGDPYDGFGYYGGDFCDTTLTTYNADRTWVDNEYDDIQTVFLLKAGPIRSKGTA